MKGLGDDAAGFSLLELLVVVALMAAVSALALPYVPGLREGLAARMAVRGAVGLLERARSEALVAGGPVDVAVDLDGRSLSLGTVRQVLPARCTLHLVTVAALVQDRGQAAMRFYADGGSSGGGLVVDCEGRRSRIAVDWLTSAVTVDERQG